MRSVNERISQRRKKTDDIRKRKWEDDMEREKIKENEEEMRKTRG